MTFRVFSDGRPTTAVNVHYKFIGGASADVLVVYSGDSFGADLLDGGDGDDDLTGFRGADYSMAMLAMTSSSPTGGTS